MKRLQRLWGKPTMTKEDRERIERAQRELELRKRRGEAIEAEVSGILRKNHLAEKFKHAFTLEEK